MAKTTDQYDKLYHTTCLYFKKTLFTAMESHIYVYLSILGLHNLDSQEMENTHSIIFPCRQNVWEEERCSLAWISFEFFLISFILTGWMQSEGQWLCVTCMEGSTFLLNKVMSMVSCFIVAIPLASPFPSANRRCLWFHRKPLPLIFEVPFYASHFVFKVTVKLCAPRPGSSGQQAQHWYVILKDFLKLTKKSSHIQFIPF